METEMELRSGWFQCPCFQSPLEGPEGTDHLTHLFTVQLRQLGPRRGNRLALNHTTGQGLIENPDGQASSSLLSPSVSGPGLTLAKAPPP